MPEDLKHPQGPRQEWTVTGMDCAACATKIKTAVSRLPGVSEVELGVMSERLKLRLEGDTRAQTVEETVRALGYGIAGKGMDAGSPHEHDHDHDHPHDHEDPAERNLPWYRTAKGRLVVLTGGLLVLAWGIEVIFGAGIGVWAFALACLIGLAPVARRAWVALRMGQPFTIESLMTIAALGALVINAAEEAALVVFLFAVGEVLEG
ncbi:MAG TPA: cation transporter, partial [Paenirhodobacter sp.]